MTDTHAAQGLSHFVEDVRYQLFLWQQQGLATALVTLVNYEGSSPRPIGSQMAVNEKGEAVGLVSGGCLETALVEEALSCIKSDSHKVVRYGKDSDYFDIQLPCGSGVDVLVSPNPNAQWVSDLNTSYQNRTPIEWRVDLTAGEYLTHALSDAIRIEKDLRSPQLTRPEMATSFTHFSKIYQPRTCVVVVGDGVIFDYFLAMAQLFDVDLVAYSKAFNALEPEAEIDPDAIFQGPRTNLQRLPLRSPDNFDKSYLDQWSAFITLSHEHDWEPDILSMALQTDAFYIGALGSRKTHERRKGLLKDLQVSDDKIAKIKAPVGLNIGGRTPPDIALSILAEIISARR